MRNVISENNLATICLDDEIMYCIFKPETLSLQEAIECVNLRLAATNSKPYPTIINMTKVKSVSKEARDYFATEAGYKDIIASALIVNSQVNKIIGNFFLSINKPPIPIKLFTNENEALEWVMGKK